MTATIASLFVAAVERYPERTFLRRIDGARDERVGYPAAAARVAALATELRTAGVRAGERIVAWLDEIEASVYATLACAHLGVVPAPIGASYSLDATRRLAARIGARVVFTTPDRAADVEASGLRAVCLPPPPVGDVGPALAALRAAAAERRPDDLYMLQPTSGTTGELKLVMRTHRVFVRVGPLMAVDLQPAAEPPARILLVAALTHGMGQYLLAMAVYLAGELCVTTRIDTGSSLAEVRRLDPTYACLTPRVLAAYHRQHAELGGDPDGPVFGPALRTLMTGGASADPSHLLHAMRHGIDPIETYGASEISLLVVTARGAWRPGVVGRVLPDVELRVADDGELLARSASRMVGYWGDDARTREAFTEDGFYRTGDFCELLDTGELRYLRRKRDVFNTADGSNIYPARIEEQLERLPGVAQAMLVGDQRPFLTALLVVDDDGRGDADDDGFLAPATHADRYARAGAALARVNRELESNERVRRFALFAARFPAAAYAVVGHGKVFRDRRVFDQRYAARIAALYAARPPGDPHDVPA